MTDLLYQIDSYAKEFDAVVHGVEGNAVLLDRTAFYPGGGGQPQDLGWLEYNGQSVPIVKIRKQGDEIWHEIQGGTPPLPGDQVHGRLDWERRYRLMRTHTAMHILCGVIWRDYGAQVTGGNMEPGKGRMDFEFERMQKELVQEIESRINAEVAAARPVKVKILPREEAFAIPDLIRTKINLLPEGISQVRTVELEGLDLQADGGTHVANTREVGALKVTGYESKGKINKRIYLELGT
ncbi:MAG: alanyl-tRNA editing protein [Chloroflexi bacterium]|nr:alanyl-tRNA editing protein [Chloroflexota bacterium]